MNTLSKVAISLAVGVVLTASLNSSAQASHVTFELNGPDTITSGSLSYTDSASGLELTASAFRFNFDQTLGQQVDLIRFIDGLGVGSVLEPPFDSSLIDSFGIYTEAVSLEFSQPVRIVSALFSYWDGDFEDDFSIVRYAPDGTVRNDAFFQDATCLSGTCTGDFNSLALSGDYSFLGFSSQFAIGAEGVNDAFSLLEVTVAPVPLPAALPLLLAGLGGLGLIARRRKS